MKEKDFKSYEIDFTVQKVFCQMQPKKIFTNQFKKLFSSPIFFRMFLLSVSSAGRGEE